MAVSSISYPDDIFLSNTQILSINPHKLKNHPAKIATIYLNSVTGPLSGFGKCLVAII